MTLKELFKYTGKVSIQGVGVGYLTYNYVNANGLTDSDSMLASLSAGATSAMICAFLEYK